MIDVKNLNKSFKSNHVLKDVSFSVQQGEIVSLIGPSGAGKSTLLRSLNWLERPDSGTITINQSTIVAGQESKQAVFDLRQHSAMVFQHYNLFKNKTVIENVTESLITVKKVNKADAQKRAEAILEQVGMSDKLHDYPSRLSGGQQQRVGIARALANDPLVMLFDEPTSALDPEWVSEVLEVIVAIAKQGMTMVLVSHEMRFVHDVSTRVILLDEGTILENGSPDAIFNHAQHERTRQFLRKVQQF